MNERSKKTPKNPLCAITVSQDVSDDRNWALHLQANGSDEKVTMMVCQFAGHGMLDEDAISEVMEEVAHKMAVLFFEYSHQKKEDRTNRKIADGIVADFIRRMKK